MTRISGTLLAVAAASACAASTSAFAENNNLLGLYAGAGIGESTVRSDDGYLPGYGYDDHDHHTGYKAIVGIRPLPVVGAELEYIDFGHPGSDDDYYNGFYYGPDSHPRAIAAFAVGHIPLPLPFLDIYGKAGAARLHTNVNGFDGVQCPDTPRQTCAPFVSTSQSVWDTRFAYGAGIQSSIWGGLSIRAEYERISSPYGDPDLFSVGATWTF